MVSEPILPLHGLLLVNWMRFSGQSTEHSELRSQPLPVRITEQEKDRIFKSVRICLAMAVAVCGGIVLFLAIFCHPLFSIFTTDQNVINIGIDMLRFMAPCYTIYVFIEILSGALRGTGDVLLPTLITLGGVCLIRIPWIMFVLPAHHTTTCVMLSYPISWITTTALIIPYYLYRKNMLTIKEN